MYVLGNEGKCHFRKILCSEISELPGRRWDCRQCQLPVTWPDSFIQNESYVWIEVFEGQDALQEFGAQAIGLK